MRSLATAGVRDVVVCPGSRSAPLAVAAIRDRGLRVHSVVDERSAGFFALGLGRATGRPAAVVCTSGTACAHLYPAVIEAAMADVPLLVVTADRPAELQGCGAPQTIDQRGLFGRFTRDEIELDGSETDSVAAAKRVAGRAAFAARGPIPGPVHLNVRFRKPLMRSGSETPIAGSETPIAGSETPIAGSETPIAGSETPIAVAPPQLRCAPAALRDLMTRLEGAKRPIVCAGPIDLGARRWRNDLFRAATAQAIPVLAESTSQLRLCPVPSGAPVVSRFADVLLETLPPPLRPDLIIQIGAPTSAGFARLCALGIERVVLSPFRPIDPQRNARAIVVGDLAGAVSAIAQAQPAYLGQRNEFVAAWRRADAQIRDRYDTVIGLSGQAAIDAVLGAMPAGAAVAVGNSLAIRWLDQSLGAGEADVDVFCQRGVNGIDGLIAGAVGVASAGDRPCCLLVGDVSFAHDVGSLAVAAAVRAPLPIVVLDNGGGKIFDELPYAAQLDATERALFTTPPALDIEAAARAFGLTASCSTSAPQLAARVSEACARPTASVLRAICSPTSRRVLPPAQETS